MSFELRINQNFNNENKLNSENKENRPPLRSLNSVEKVETSKKRTLAEMGKSDFSPNVKKVRPADPAKVKEEFVELNDQGEPKYKYSLAYNDLNFDLVLFHRGTNNQQHHCYHASHGKENYIAKTYNHILRPNFQRDLMTGDALGCEKIENFLKENNITGFRVAKMLLNPLRAGFLLAEKIEGDSKYFQEWAGDKPFDTLSPQAKEILSYAREFIALMWEKKFDSGDFRPQNCIWQNSQLVIVDYLLKKTKKQLANNLNSYIKHWSNGNQEVSNYFYEKLQDLKDIKSLQT